MITLDRNTLIMYIEKLYLLEKSKYEQTLLLQKLISNRQMLKNQNEMKISYYTNKRKIGYHNNVPEYGVAGGFYGLIIGLLAGIFTDITFSSNLKGFMIFGFGGVAVGVGIAFFENMFANVNIDKENNRINRENQNLQIQHHNLIKNNEKKLQNLQDGIAIIQNKLCETQRVLDTYYKRDIIYPKYQGFIPISSFLEYLKSGRCDSLMGHEGAYNIYENEMRLNLIITKMDDVIRQLENIRSAQYMLYDAVTNANSVINKLVQRMDSVTNNLSDIKNDAVFIRYNTEISAKNSEFIKWITYLKA